MPVKLTDRAFGQMLLRARNIVAGRQVRNDRLAHPPASQDSRLGVREAPFEVRHDAVVSALLAQIVRVLKVKLPVGAAYIHRHRSATRHYQHRFSWHSLTRDRGPFSVPVDRLAIFEPRFVILAFGR